MKITFEEAQVIFTTVLLLPAMVALIVFTWRRSSADSPEQWNPRRIAERDWWSQEDAP